MNLANKLTLFRIFLVPVFMVFLLVDIPYGSTIAAIIFIIAALTDMLDGHIARSRNMITKFGKFMDPLADKLLVSAALISLTEMGIVPSWMVVIIIAREFAITGLRVLAASEGITIAASKWGKVKTITQLVAIISILLNNFPFNYVGLPFDRFMLVLAVIFTIISGLDYIYKNINLFNLQD
ncbi:CDP-diacylglycerol--glycerol-3-phosphate 3-phosphatidyltransferase [Clostridium sp. D2Q-11]|uniref:CDP-diacylglycerol--glycerol-3-phosphate 3-phosphatidyltransferase n=1 Tax=Anaeromonas frigoriresistens TaxID=2683708 RepID=A0A942UZJ9_9FIRM|nr:CDP-diacylglycerol--glycerol-3-phosphate 3-phosphatidyltransferase [Anaeromonas frigoriresistens]MBS4539906.1 CDP-diacylglycerol--glycerol-3-phosphate 3-phosphatidyltransferase [Anaeromonas frigoriresistens]